MHPNIGFYRTRTITEDELTLLVLAAPFVGGPGLDYRSIFGKIIIYADGPIYRMVAPYGLKRDKWERLVIKND